MNLFAQESNPCLFIGRYDKEKSGIVCSERGWVYEEVKDIQEYEVRKKQFREEHKTDNPSTDFVSSKQCVIVYEFQKKISGWGCTPMAYSLRIGTTIENCEKEMAAYLSKYPDEFKTQPKIVFTWKGKGGTQKPTLTEDSGGVIGSGNKKDSVGSASYDNSKNSEIAISKTCPTYNFKYSSISYNCVALEWWSMSTKVNMVDAVGDFKQSTDPQPKFFTIQFRKQGDIYWTFEKRENTGKNTHTISGLDACTKYEIQLIATCDNNQVSAPTNIIRFTTACNKPGNLSVENITSNSAKINSQRLTASVSFPCASSASTQIRIVEFKTSTGTWEEVFCNSGSPCILNALNANTIYKVRARFKYGNNLYSNYTNEISFTTKNN